MTDYRSIFNAITSDSRCLANLDWGKPRRGHPEATIRAHIADLEKNLDSISAKITEDDYWRLRILIHVHDAFKPDACGGVRITDPRSHASLARAFLGEYLDESDLLNVVQFHDEPYALYLRFESKGSIDENRIDALIHSIGDWDLFLAFLIIDNCIPGKSRQPLLWFFCQLEGKVRSIFTCHDILP